MATATTIGVMMRRSIEKGQTYNVLVKMLLRHFAKNRRRSWRNGLHDAFVDACIQVEGPLAVFVVAPLVMAELVLKRTIMPWLAQIAFDKVTKGAMIVGLISVAVFIVVDTSFKRYESIPGVETQFDSEWDRKLVNIYFASGFVVLVGTILLTFWLRGALPESP
jgi:hypothetical protein